MPRAPNTSPQTLAVLCAFATAPKVWRYGLSITKETGLKSGTLYPLLMRLSDAGLLEAKWMPAEQPGRPPRHGYRLTAAGVAFARDLRKRAAPKANLRLRVKPA